MLAQTRFVILPFEVLDTSWWWLSLFMGCKSLTIDMAEECPPKVLNSEEVKCEMQPMNWTSVEGLKCKILFA
ncbi:MAG: hypothetical protein ACTS41_01270 [Candidatus Hodgkinia cicadicola]